MRVRLPDWPALDKYAVRMLPNSCSCGVPAIEWLQELTDDRQGFVKPQASTHQAYAMVSLKGGAADVPLLGGPSSVVEVT